MLRRVRRLQWARLSQLGVELKVPKLLKVPAAVTTANSLFDKAPLSAINVMMAHQLMGQNHDCWPGHQRKYPEHGVNQVPYLQHRTNCPCDVHDSAATSQGDRAPWWRYSIVEAITHARLPQGPFSVKGVRRYV